MTAAISCCLLGRVRVQPATTHFAYHQTCQHIRPHAPVLGLLRRPHPLDCGECHIIHQCLMRRCSEHSPLRRCRLLPRTTILTRSTVPVPHLPAGVSQILQNPDHRPHQPRLPGPVPIPLTIDTRRATTALPRRHPDHHPPLRPPLAPHRPTPTLGRRPTHHHPLAPPHHPHLDRTPPQLRHRRPPQPHRHHHTHLPPRRPQPPRHRPGVFERRTPPTGAW